jgi:hydroxyacyl-ACP dehydratase HTD2-like protein with hotdog domain
MFVLQPGSKQYCSHQTHDGTSKKHPKGAAPATRKIWPTGHISFAEAVKVYSGATTKAAVEPSALPTLDINLEV